MTRHGDLRSFDSLPSEVLEMVRREPPVSHVVPSSTPVIAFGDPFRATVATLGINPSGREFVEDGHFLDGSSRRLATLPSLGAERLGALSDAQVREVLTDCARYFEDDRNPYRRWFNPLDRVLQAGVEASYYAGTACHLDLVQWATDPIWSGLEESSKQRLLAEGLPHLRTLLELGATKLVLLNGRAVLAQVEALGLVELAEVAKLPLGTRSCTLYRGDAGSIQYVGWSTNLQSSFGVSNAFKQRLATWIAQTTK